jgi:ABC-type branched-subunit amino acid transport system ATPase component
VNGLRVRGLRAAYGRARVLDGVELDVEPGQVIGLAGRNGVGKTTTLRAISGLLPRRADELSFAGEALTASPRDVARRGVVHVPEGRGVLRSLTVEENLRFGAIAVGARYGRAERDQALTWFPALAGLLDRRAGLLSGGEQQMLALARGLMARPKVLMVDELSLGLSPRAVADAMASVLAACRGRGSALLIVDQNLRVLAATCDRLYVLAGGVTTGYDDPAERTDAFWRSVYL